MGGMTDRVAAALLLAAGGSLTTLAAAQPWVHLQVEDALAVTTVEVTGSSLVPLATATGLVGLAALLALFAVRSWARRAVAVVVVVLALVALVQTALVLTDLHDRARQWWAVEVGAAADSAQATSSPWPYLAMVALAALVAGALLVLVRGSDWPGLSTRYEKPSRAADTASSSQDGASGVWQALDRGEDPTEPDGSESR